MLHVLLGQLYFLPILIMAVNQVESSTFAVVHIFEVK